MPRIIKAEYILFLTVSTKMRNGEQQRMEHMKWVTLTTIAIFFVVDATILDPESKESIVYNGETVKQGCKKDFEKKVIYEGDQVWRIYKHNDSVNDLVEQYDEYGCT